MAVPMIYKQHAKCLAKQVLCVSTTEYLLKKSMLPAKFCKPKRQPIRACLSCEQAGGAASKGTGVGPLGSCRPLRKSLSLIWLLCTAVAILHWP